MESHISGDRMISIQSSQPATAVDEVESRGEHGTGENQQIATRLDEIAALLTHQGASDFRVHAYVNAAKTLRELRYPVRDVLDDEGVGGLVALPTIGRSIANVIEQYLRTGRIPLLDRLRGEDAAERIFATLPGVGPELSHRIHEQLEIETLPELMAAVGDGRLEKVPGMGRKRVHSIAECLAQRLRHPSAPSKSDTPQPADADESVPVSELLDVDAEYRRLAERGKLPKIAPLKFNPAGTAWLPILHTHRDDRHYTALYSNSARAHQLNTIKDWVVIYRDDPESHARWTVITSQFGKLRGWRIVRGREDECSEYYIQNDR